MEINLASPPDRELLVAEVMVDDEQWVELNQEGGSLNLEVYPRRDGQPWRLDFDAAVAALVEMRRRLVGDA